MQSCITDLNSKSKQKIIITKDYLLRRDVTKREKKSGFYIEKIIPLDSQVPPNNFKNINLSKLLCKTKGLIGDTIHFNKKQTGVTWYSFREMKLVDHYGVFEKATWYHFSQIYKTYDYFIYVDSIGNINQYRYNKSNW